MKKILQLSTVFGAAIILVNASAQDTKDEKNQRITFHTASWEPVDDAFYYIKGGTDENPEFEQISLTEMSRSLPYQVNAGSSVSFYKKGTEENFQKSLTVSLPAMKPDQRRYLLLFMPPKDGQYPVKVIPDSREHSPFGAYAFYNFGNLPIKGRLADQRFDIEPGEHQLVKINLEPGVPMAFATMTKVNGQPKWLQRNTFHFNPKKHSKFFLHRVPTTNDKYKIEAKAIVEFEPDKKQPTETPPP